MTICVIPARGNSKRLPGKNLLKFQGKPLVQIAVETAISSGCFSKVIVSSEDSRIISLVRDIPNSIASVRPVELSGDDIRADEIIRWEIEKNASSHEEVYCCLLPTTPLLTPIVLAQAFRMYASGVLFGVIPSSETPFRSFKLNSDDSGLEALFPKMLNLQSQDYPVTVVDAGQFYFAQAGVWIQNFSITACPEAKGFLLDPRLAIDINYPGDWDKINQNA